MKYDITHALERLTPGASWVMIDMSYDKLDWQDEVQSKPSLQDIENKLAELAAAEPMRLLRLERDKRIAETDWWVLPDRTPTPEQLSYRQALRDITVDADPKLDSKYNLDMSSINWPVKP